MGMWSVKMPIIELRKEMGVARGTGRLHDDRRVLV